MTGTKGMYQVSSTAGQFLVKSLRWLSIWWSYFRSRVWHLLLLLFAGFSVLILVLTAVYHVWAYFHGKVLPPELLAETDEVITVFLVVAAYSIGFFAFVWLFVLSVFPQTRRMADKLIMFSEPIEKRVGKIESDLTTIKCELTSINKRLREAKGMGTKGRKNVKKPKKAQEKKQEEKKK